MRDLNSMRVDSEFWMQNDVDLLCRACSGEGSNEDGEDCEECDGSGAFNPIWNTIWNTGFSDRALPDGPRAIGAVLAFSYEGNVWFGLMGAGMDMSPHLCEAWLTMFPDCEWVPQEWASITNLMGSYFESCIGEEMTRRIVVLYARSLRARIEADQASLNEIQKYLDERFANLSV